MFDLKLFGGLSLESSSAPLAANVHQRRRLSLLAILALAGERGISRERVQAHLWPESAAERARHALDQLLYATRQNLGHDAILSSTSDLRLNRVLFRVDVWEFDHAVSREDWDCAVQLYKGPILNGHHLISSSDFQLWLDAERNQRERDYHRALEALARDATARGEHKEAVQWWLRRSTADPLSAPVALDLMRALAAAGDGTGAVKHARAHQQLVRTALEVEPDPTVDALAATLASRCRPLADDMGSTDSLGTDLSADGPGDSGEPPIAPGAPSELPVTRTPRVVRRSRRIHVAIAALALSLVATSILVRAEWHPSSQVSATSVDRGRTQDAEAHALYLRGRVEWQKRTQDGLGNAVVLFRRATERDPMYAAAFAGLAQSYAMLAYFGFADADAMFPKARAAALRAIEFDSGAGEAYAALGQALAWQHEWKEAETAYRRAIALAPDDATVRQWYALLLAYAGRIDEAVLQTRDASSLDPLSVQINNMHGMMLFHSGDIAGALRQFERTVRAEPDSVWVWQNPWVLSNFGRVAAAAGRHSEAVRLIETAIHAVPGHPRPLLDLAHVYIDDNDPMRARAAFARADTSHAHYEIYRALLHALLGEFDEAFARFQMVNDWPLPALLQVNNERHYLVFRADPRFQEIRKRLNLPPR
ncbi:MAG TPA: tetratricopeptide repeat protein [Gemmatimonadaceae bacterium]|nr:tetratricopeptide repeat protein [Gemmatimonadaceae bacterium]